MARKQDEERSAILERLLEQFPDREELSLERGQVLQRLGLYEEALAAYTQALQRNPENGEARRSRGQLCFERGYLVQAEQDWDNLFQSHQADEDVYLGKIQALTLLGNYYGSKGADSYCDEAIAAYPEQTTFYLQKALNPIKKTWPYDAQFLACEQVLFLCKQQESSLSSALYRDKGQALYLLGRYEEALTAFEQSLHLDPADPRTHTLKAHMLQASGQEQLALVAFEAAIQAYGQRFRRYPRTPVDLLAQGELLCSLQRFEEGLAVVEQALQVDPGSARSWFVLGGILLNAHRYTEALSAYEQAIKLSPRYENVTLASWHLLIVWLRHARTLADCDRGLLATPENIPLLVQKAHSLSGLQRSAEALAVCEQALQLSLSSPAPALLADIYLELGIALQALNRYTEALAAYHQSGKLLRRRSIGSHEFSYIVNCLAEVVQAQERLLHDPTDMLSVKLLLENLTHIKNRQAARETYQSICQSAPDDPELLLQVLALSHYDQTAALACYQRLLRLAPDDIRVYNGYASLLYALNRYDEALLACEQAKQLQTDQNWSAGLQGTIEALFQQRDRVVNNLSNASVEILRRGGSAWNAWLVTQADHSHNLRSLDLSKLDLHAADLSNMDLRQSILSESDLHEANLQQANLQQANLSWTNLSGTNLREANLSQATLKTAFLFLPRLTIQPQVWQKDELLPPAITDFCTANLHAANLSQVCLDYALFNEADLSNVDLTCSLLRYVNFRQANLTQANLRGASLTGADLSGARLWKVDLTNADLRGARLDGADLSGANLFETRLENASLQGVDLTQTLSRPPDKSASASQPPLISFEHAMVPPNVSTVEMRPGILTTLLRCQAPDCSTTMKLELVAEGIPHEDDPYQVLRVQKQKPPSFICDYLPNYSNSWHPTGLSYSRLELALRRGDVALLNLLNEQYTPFYCSCCHGVYCYDHMHFKEGWDDYYPHPDYWYGTCPYGHSIFVNH